MSLGPGTYTKRTGTPRPRAQGAEDSTAQLPLPDKVPTLISGETLTSLQETVRTSMWAFSSREKQRNFGYFHLSYIYITQAHLWNRVCKSPSSHQHPPKPLRLCRRTEGCPQSATGDCSALNRDQSDQVSQPRDWRLCLAHTPSKSHEVVFRGNSSNLQSLENMRSELNNSVGHARDLKAQPTTLTQPSAPLLPQLAPKAGREPYDRRQPARSRTAPAATAFNFHSVRRVRRNISAVQTSSRRLETVLFHNTHRMWEAEWRFS